MNTAVKDAVNKSRNAIDEAVKKLTPADYREALEDLASMIELRINGLDEENGDDE